MTMAGSRSLTLQEAAQELQVSPKTLNRWLEAAEITPETDRRDRRKRLLSPGQMSRLRDLFGGVAAPDSQEAGTQLLALSRRVTALEMAVASLNTWLTSLSENITALTQRALETDQQQPETPQENEAEEPALAMASAISQTESSEPLMAEDELLQAIFGNLPISPDETDEEEKSSRSSHRPENWLPEHYRQAE